MLYVSQSLSDQFKCYNVFVLVWTPAVSTFMETFFWGFILIRFVPPKSSWISHECYGCWFGDKPTRTLCLMMFFYAGKAYRKSVRLFTAWMCSRYNGQKCYIFPSFAGYSVPICSVSTSSHTSESLKPFRITKP